jgi:hypothetical protein
LPNRWQAQRIRRDVERLTGSGHSLELARSTEEDNELSGERRRCRPKPLFPIEDVSQIDASMQDCEADHLWMEAEVEVKE